MLSFFFLTWYTLSFSALASATSAPEAEETYIECGTAAGSTLKLANVDDVNCVTLQQLVEPYAGKVFSHALQDDGSWLTTVSNTTIEEAEADSQLSIQRTNEELDDLTVLDIPCRTHVETWFTTNNWGYWSNSWKQIGGCYYCKDCNYAASSSASVTQSWSVGLGADFDLAISASFGYSWGQTKTIQNTLTCNWKNEDYGCHSIWFQPLMSYHNGWPNWQVRAYSPAACGFTVTGHKATYANVNAYPVNDGSVHSGNWSCDSGCQGSDHRQCKYKNTGGPLWPASN